MPLPFRSFALISRAQIAANYRSIRETVGTGVAVAGVVKADAYGHGATEVSKVLEAEGARWLAVSSVGEGAALRRDGIRARILVMAGFLPEEKDALLEFDLTPTAHSLAEIAELDCLARASGKALRYHVKVDSGMGRLGTRASAAEIAEAVRNARNAVFEGLMSHLASPSDFASAQTAEQAAYFQAVRAELAPALAHLASTNAIAYGRRDAWHDIVRAGLSLYGYVSPSSGNAPAANLDVKPALTWRARVLEVKEVPAGTPVGYSATYRAARPMRVAIVAAGYADGVFRQLSNRGHVIAGGKLAPILGIVSMDVTTIDASDAPALMRGDEVTLLGSEGAVTLDAEQIAATAGTISYDILCSIGARVRRVYV